MTMTNTLTENQWKRIEKKQREYHDKRWTQLVIQRDRKAKHPLQYVPMIVRSKLRR